MFKKSSLKYQYLICIALVIIMAAISYPFSYLIGYRSIALILLMAVTVTAMLFVIMPVLAAASLSALVWNFFFIPPKFSFHIGEREDWLLFFLKEICIE